MNIIFWDGGGASLYNKMSHQHLKKILYYFNCQLIEEALLDYCIQDTGQLFSFILFIKAAVMGCNMAASNVRKPRGVGPSYLVRDIMDI